MLAEASEATRPMKLPGSSLMASDIALPVAAVLPLLLLLLRRGCPSTLMLLAPRLALVTDMLALLLPLRVMLPVTLLLAAVDTTTMAAWSPAAASVPPR
jgi:hypothetical protein